ncbi:PAS domain-containing protein [Methylobacterium sp. J-076]|uniref:PAS domain-containing protein n=1 Tax=Methylobacterium sp. J-076 TaxID=2836655 RepID=UPI001FB88344|nr:PAS domain-containing protein [Methylobacterium sp. J-076]MCJ2012218.1 PAS domain-containing protein [Methylobacterium sp. J-076]
MIPDFNPDHPARLRRDHALAAAGIIGTWEWDHRRQIARYCAGAAELLAGDASLAGHDLAMSEALAGVHTDDVAWLRSQMRQSVSAPDIRIREHRVNSSKQGVRRVLCRGRTYYDESGSRTFTLGIVIDITEVEADGRRRFARGINGPLDDAAEHGVAAYEAIEATGLRYLLKPARELLMALGREIARGLSLGRQRPH